MARNEQVKKSVGLSTSHMQVVLDMLDQIVEAGGYMSRSAAVDQCIRAMHAKMFPAYSAPRPATVKPSADDKRETTAEKTEREQIELCEELGGVVEGDGAARVCVYSNWHFAKEYVQRIPVGKLTHQMVENQFTPSREAVEKAKSEV